MAAMAPPSDPRGRPLDGFAADTYGDRFVDVYDDWYPDVTDTEACVATVEALARDVATRRGTEPRVLELGVGTGRLAIPLAERGVHVTGLDASPAMLAAMAAKPGGERVRAVLGDMADLAQADQRFDVVLVAYNTLFNLVEEGAQQRCLDRSGDALTPGGLVVVEAFVPDNDIASGDTVTTRQVTAERVVLSVSRTDADAHLVVGQYVDITEAGVKLRPWQLRWSSPEELDHTASSAGLALVDRWSDWHRTPITPNAPTHISLYPQTTP